MTVAMSAQSTIIQSDVDDEVTLSQKKRAALDLIIDAWCNGLEEGIENEILAHAALFAALSDLIDVYGEDAVANLAARLPQRIHDGEFTITKNIQ